MKRRRKHSIIGLHFMFAQDLSKAASYFSSQFIRFQKNNIYVELLEWFRLVNFSYSVGGNESRKICAVLHLQVITPLYSVIY